MRHLLIIAASMSIPFALGNAVADDSQPLLSVSNLTAPMSDAELGDVKGSFSDFCFLCALGNNATVTQLNVSAASALVGQSNSSGVTQSNN